MYIRYSTEYFKYGIPYECAFVGTRVDTFPENSDLTRLHITQHFPDQVTGTNLPLNAIYSVHTLVSGLLISTKKVWNKACMLSSAAIHLSSECDKKRVNTNNQLVISRPPKRMKKTWTVSRSVAGNCVPHRFRSLGWPPFAAALYLIRPRRQLGLVGDRRSQDRHLSHPSHLGSSCR